MRIRRCGSPSWATSSGSSSPGSRACPRPGEIAHALETWEEPAGGGAVAAAQLARLAGSCLFFTALGADELGRRSRAELTRLGIDVRAIPDAEPTRRAFTFVDETGERTITVLGEKLRPKRRRQPPAMAGAGRSRRRLLRQRRRRGASTTHVWRACSWRPRASSRRCARPASSSTRSSEAGRTRASSTAPESSTRLRTPSSRPPAGSAAGSSRVVHFGLRPCLAPSWMRTAAGTASPAGSPSGSARGDSDGGRRRARRPLRRRRHDGPRAVRRPARRALSRRKNPPSGVDRWGTVV